MDCHAIGNVCDERLGLHQPDCRKESLCRRVCNRFLFGGFVRHVRILVPLSGDDARIGSHAPYLRMGYRQVPGADKGGEADL
ncbi:unknown [Bacteroides sp. CAG:702]|nr:unknown [Bacteroides sp. CAG:702]